MATSYYLSPQSDRFVRPVAIAVMATMTLLTTSFGITYACSALGLDLFGLARILFALTAMTLLILAAQIWRLYFLIATKLAGHPDRKITWLASAITGACVLSTAIIAFTSPAINANSTDNELGAVISAQVLSVLSTAFFAAKSTFSIAALFEALRATEKARRF